MVKILIIDDSVVIRNLLMDFLSDEGYQVDTTEDGREGIRLAIDGDYDVCICDTHLATMSGYDVFCEVAAKRPELQFVITDSLPDHLSVKTRKAGAYWYLKKPFDLDQLREVLTQIVSPVKAR